MTESSVMTGLSGITGGPPPQPTVAPVTREPTPDEVAAREAAQAAQLEMKDLFLRCVLAVVEGVTRGIGANVRAKGEDLFEIFGRKLAAGTFLHLNDARLAYQGDERDMFVEAFLKSVSGVVGKIGIKESQGRVIPTAQIVAEHAVGMIATARETVEMAIRDAAQRQNGQYHPPIRSPFVGEVQAPSSPVSSGTMDALKYLGV